MWNAISLVQDLNSYRRVDYTPGTTNLYVWKKKKIFYTTLSVYYKLNVLRTSGFAFGATVPNDTDPSIKEKVKNFNKCWVSPTFFHTMNLSICHI